MIPEDVNYCLRCGEKLKNQHKAGRERPVCPSCDWIFFPDPKVAAAVLVTQNKMVLLTRRVNEPQKGYWTLPVGFVDAGEHPARAAERECIEETGLSVHTTELLDVIFGQEHGRGSHILILYRAEIIGGNLKPGDDVDDVGFFALDQIPPLAFPHTTQTILTQYV